jgi:hypothetical protein
MKRILLSLFILSLLSCYWTPEEGVTEWQEVAYPSDYDPVYDVPSPGYETVVGIVYWSEWIVKYEREEVDYWKAPIESYTERRGDCEDLAILALYMVRQELGIKGELVLGWNPETKEGHAWVRIDGAEYYEMPYDYPETRVVTYAEAMYRGEVVKK